MRREQLDGSRGVDMRTPEHWGVFITNIDGREVHVAPCTSEGVPMGTLPHNLDGPECWCRPRIERYCNGMCVFHEERDMVA